MKPTPTPTFALANIPLIWTTALQAQLHALPQPTGGSVYTYFELDVSPESLYGGFDTWNAFVMGHLVSASLQKFDEWTIR